MAVGETVVKVIFRKDGGVGCFIYFITGTRVWRMEKVKNKVKRA